MLIFLLCCQLISSRREAVEPKEEPPAETHRMFIFVDRCRPRLYIRTHVFTASYDDQLSALEAQLEEAMEKEVGLETLLSVMQVCF